MNSVGMVRSSMSPVEQRAGGARRWLAFPLLFWPFVGFAAPSAATYSITDFVTCSNAKTEAPHDWHVPQAVFRTDDDKLFAWVELRDVSGVRPVEMRLYHPDGTYYGKETQVINETNGVADWWRMAAWWRIKGDRPAQTPGRWRLDLVVDGTLQRSIYFNINAASPVPVGPVVPAQTTPSPALASAAAGVCVIESSSDLVHWLAIQTNALPTATPRGAMTARGGFRLTPGGGGVRSCVLEASPDLLQWTRIQTNDLPLESLVGASGAAVATACFYRAVIH